MLLYFLSKLTLIQNETSMGTKIIEPVPGDICLRWDPVDETPSFVYVVFWDVLKGDRFGAKQPPNEHIFKLPQDPTSSCKWEYENLVSDWHVDFQIAVDQSGVGLSDASGMGNFYFTDVTGPTSPPEYQLYHNFFQDPFGKWGYNGSAMVFWMTALGITVVDFGLQSAPDLFLEMFSFSDASFVQKLCSLSLVTNFTMKILR